MNLAPCFFGILNKIFLALPAVAAILQAIAWPSVALVFLAMFRAKVFEIVDVLVAKVKDATHVKAGQFELDTEQKIRAAVDKAGESARYANPQIMERSIPEAQIRAAHEVSAQLRAAPIGYSQQLGVAQNEIQSLIDQYEATRTELSSGPNRTRKMNEIAAKMRAVSIAAYPLLPLLMRGEKAGARLAAICVGSVQNFV
ncbi:MAG: hypothetical protein P4M01_07680 [Acidobacteriota bacterium]|nr:hypothetical protein [Acidobacteriota bacterium]